MEEKDELIHSMLAGLRRIIDKHIQIDEQPRVSSEGLVLSPRENRALDLIGSRQRTNVTDVGTYFGFTKSAASQLVSRLVKKGLVNKVQAAHSNKEFQLLLTDSGECAHDAYKKSQQAHISNLTQRLEAFSMQQIATTSVLLEIVENAMNERMASMK